MRAGNVSAQAKGLALHKKLKFTAANAEYTQEVS